MKVALTGSDSHWLSVMVGGTAGPTAKSPQPGPAVVMAVILSGAVPLLTICTVCVPDGVTDVPGNGGLGATFGVMVAWNGWNVAGFAKMTGAFAGFTIRH